VAGRGRRAPGGGIPRGDRPAPVRHGEREPEASRQFTRRWGYSFAQAGAELARLRFSLGDGLPPALRRTIDLLLAQAMPAWRASAASSGTPGKMWATASLYHMVDDMLTARAGNQELREQLSDAQAAPPATAPARPAGGPGRARPGRARPGGRRPPGRACRRFERRARRRPRCRDARRRPSSTR
jgi:hypothetical protein